MKTGFIGSISSLTHNALTELVGVHVEFWVQWPWWHGWQEYVGD